MRDAAFAVADKIAGAYNLGVFTRLSRCSAVKDINAFVFKVMHVVFCVVMVGLHFDNVKAEAGKTRQIAKGLIDAFGNFY